MAHIAAKVPASDKGTAVAGMMVAHSRRRNSAITITTMATVTASVFCTSATDARIIGVRSLRMAMWTLGGIQPSSVGNSARMASTVSTTLDPVCFITLMSTARWPSYHAAVRLFSGASITSATSPSRMMAPFFSLTIRLR